MEIEILLEGVSCVDFAIGSPSEEEVDLLKLDTFKSIYKLMTEDTSDGTICSLYAMSYKNKKGTCFVKFCSYQGYGDHESSYEIVTPLKL